MRAAFSAMRQRFPAEHLLNFGSFVVARIIALAFFAGSVAYYLSVADAASYGEAALLLTVFSLLQASDLGLAYAFNLRFTRAVSTGLADRHAIIQGALPFYVLIACTFGLVAIYFAPLVSNLAYGDSSHAESLKRLAVGVSLALLSSFFSAIVQAFNKLYLLNASRGLADMLKAGALCLAAHQGIDQFALLLAFASLIKLLVDFLLAGRMVGFNVLLQPKFSLQGIREDLAVGLPMFAALWLSLAVTVIDKIYVSRVFGPERLGYYSLAYDVCTKAFFLAFALTSSLYVVQIRRLATGRSSRELILMGFAGVCAIGLLYYLPLAIFAPDILRIWISEELSLQAAGVTRAAVVMAICYLSMNVLYNALQAGGRSVSILAGWLVAVAWIVVGFWLMPRSWGETGVMWVLAGAFAVQGLYYAIGVLPMLKSEPAARQC